MFYGSLAHFFIIDAAAVVLYLYINVVAAMVRPHSNIAGITLALLVSLFVSLKPMGHRSAHQVNQRIRYLLDDVVIQLRLSASQRELYFLVYGFSRIAHGT